MATYKYWCPAAGASSSSPRPLNPSMCLVPANPDISGIGVRIAIYLQNLLGFIPAVWAVWDWKVTDHELESAETQSTTNLVLAFAILISCIVQAFTLGLTSYHATVVLSLSWMNNTNAFIYFLLYVHYKSQGLEPQVAPQWSSWIKHIQGQTKALFSLPTISLATTIGAQAATHNVASQTGRKDGKGGVKVLFRRIALFLGSLHLTLMAGLGIWLWSSPRSFGIADASCAVDSAHLAIVGARVPFGSNALRVVSLAVYSLFILPGFNLLLPMSAFLGLYLWHHARWVKVQSGTSASAAVGPIRARIARLYRTAVASPVFAVFVGLGFLLVVNIVFVADIELTLRRNQGIQETEEKQWGFGQILAMLLVFLPLRDVVEMILARRLHRQEEQIRKHVQAAAWTKAVLRKDVSSILQLVDEGADPNVSVEGGWTALEVAIVAQNSNAVHFLTHARHCAANVAIKFHDGRTPLQVAALDDNWEIIRILVDAKVDIDAVNADGQTALELAALEKKWGVAEGLITAGANPNLIFRDGRTVLELAANGRRWGTVRCLAGAAADLNHCFKGCKPDVWGEVDDGVANVRTILHAACYHREHDLISFLLDKGADPNAVAFEAEDEGKPGPPLMGAFEYGSAFHYVCSIEGDAALPLVRKALECGADPNLQGLTVRSLFRTDIV
ncbi:ankyrin [Coprinellus micaceus]|uniref:Ankyrin n=1 Tax=Coprinellus micaceus TaxID=71717 RepID=A0A4Y7T5Q2_COPMI|nr:ankyrin [Coprinellus micaceus]